MKDTKLAAGLALLLLTGTAAPVFAQGTPPAAPSPTAPATATIPVTNPAADPGTTPAPAAVPDASGIAASTENAGETANPYGLDALWRNGDLVARGTLVLLVLMSLGTWYVMITKFVQQSIMMARARAANNNFWKSPSIADGAKRLGNSSVFGYLARTGVSATDHHEGELSSQVDKNTWVQMMLDRAVTAINSRLQGGLALLATVASTAPFVGLFGTVWGIYHALTAIGIAGQASIDKVAGPVGEALIMTAIGLATAVPAVLGYNFLVRRNKAVMERVRNFSAELHTVLLSGSRIGQKPMLTQTVAARPMPAAAE